MGNAAPPTGQTTTIGNAYLAKVLQGVKREVDSHVEIQCVSTREMYYQWKTNVQAYKEKIGQFFPNDASSICNSLLFPSSIRYEQNQNICGDKHGKVVLQFSSGFLSLQQSKCLHIQENMPYTSSQIWNLLFCMVEYSLLIKQTSLPLDIRSESIYTDLRTKIIKLRNPYSFLGIDIKYKHQKYIDTQKIELVIRGLKIPKEIQEQNEAFNIGMTLVQIMLLEPSCLIYDEGLSSHRVINTAIHQMLVQKVLKIVYYPLKLRIVIAGLIQLNSRDRFTVEEIHQLLKDSKDKVKNCNIFHLRKTAFINIFKQKLNAVERSIAQIKQESHSEIFKDVVPFSFYSEGKPHKHVPFFNNPLNKNTSHADTPAENMDHSLNFSITHLGHTNRNAENESLMLSKSQNKSSIFPQKQLVKEKSVLSSGPIKSSQKSALSLQMTSPPPASEIKKTASINKSSQTPQQKNGSQPPPQLSQTPDEHITNPFDNFEEQDEKPKQSQQICKLSSASKKTPPRYSIPQEKSDQRQSNSLKVQEGSIFQPVKQLISSDPRQSANLQMIQTQKKISVEAGKENEQEDISCISPSGKDISQNNHSRNSSVVQYVSQLYETQKVLGEQKLEAKRTNSRVEDNNGAFGQARKSKQSEEDRLFYSFEPQKLFIRKTESYEIQSNSRTSLDCPPPPKQVMHQGSIIDKLATLVKSKKGPPEEAYKPDNLTDSARKRIEYWNTFSKFSPEVIAQLHLPARYPDSERLKRSMRETISYNNIAISRSKKMFPEGQRQSTEEDQKINAD